MAYLAQLGAQVDELIASLCGANLDEESVQKQQAAHRESVLRSLRHHTFLRVNQFDVQDQLNGFEERFRVIGREALANALNARLEALEVHQTKWTPDILRFLLELSDQPAQKAKLSDLDLLWDSGSEAEDKPKLTWQTIAKEDGWLEDRALWRNVDYSPSSGEDEEEVPSADSDAESLTTASSSDEYHRTAEELVSKQQDGELILNQVQQSQAWRQAVPLKDGETRAKKIAISSFQMLREVLFMLGGLETTLFDANCDPILNYQLVDVSWETYRSFVTSFAECGRKLAPLRSFVKKKEGIPLLQVFQDSVGKALHSLDQELASIQARFVAVKQDTVVSLSWVLAELGPSLAPLNCLSNIVQQVQEERNTHAFRYLELLFDAVGIAQLDGSIGTYKTLGRIFFDCFQVYLKPIRLWMEDGKLLPGDRTFFVSESPTRLPLPDIWKGRFNLLRTPEGILHAPRFLQPAIGRIFTTGKSIVVLKHLRHHELVRNRRDQAEPRMDFATVCPDHMEFAPFSELFGAAFQAWIQSKHHTAAATLRELLFNSYGLTEGLAALHHIYLMTDGSRWETFASALFRHLDSYSVSWRDRFTLTEIAQEAFSSCIDSYRLSASISSRSLAHSGAASRSSVRISLPAIQLSYRLDWPVQIIVPEEAVQGYRTIFTFLLQIRRAVALLAHPIVGFSSGSGETVDHHATYYLLRTKLLWFCNMMMTYITTLVLAPNISRLQEELKAAPDVDDMISAHSSFISRVINESCQGSKLQPIRECILDIFDLAIKVEDAHGAEMTRLAEEEEEVSRLSVMSSPYKVSPSKGKGRKSLLLTPKKKKVSGNDDESEDDEDWKPASLSKSSGRGAEKSHGEVLKGMHGEFERHLRFVAGGLRGVARAGRDEATAKWDLLAEMLEVGIRE
ncbi:Spc98 family-domain-containing protein [Echria macrotheca]|uniref:Spindle pole body component n=1 Tax=Echria macrotheca TaxID=438768 RepID=A0AAJ0FA74_9PEZI|nr:Spc98 family-domain-containing protein [Echria macrotheca]